MARRLIKRSLTDRTKADILIDEAHAIASDSVSVYSVHEFNRTLIELVVKECANLTRTQMLSFMTEPDAYTGKVFLEETIYNHFSMEKKE